MSTHTYDAEGWCACLGGDDILHNEREQVYVYSTGGDVMDYFSDFDDWAEARGGDDDDDDEESLV